VKLKVWRYELSVCRRYTQAEFAAQIAASNAMVPELAAAARKREAQRLRDALDAGFASLDGAE
jgi:hypothetical protein